MNSTIDHMHFYFCSHYITAHITVFYITALHVTSNFHTKKILIKIIELEVFNSYLILFVNLLKSRNSETVEFKNEDYLM